METSNADLSVWSNQTRKTCRMTGRCPCNLARKGARHSEKTVLTDLPAEMRPLKPVVEITIANPEIQP
jgi:hypothetical protein